MFPPRGDGPIQLGPFPFPEPVMRPDTFQSIGQSLIEAHRGLDTVLTDRLRQLAGVGRGDLDGDFAATVVPALQNLDALAGVVNADEPIRIVADIDVVAAQLGLILADLPDPNSPDPNLDAPPPDANPGDGHDIVITPTSPGPTSAPPVVPSDLIGPDELRALVIELYTQAAGHPPAESTLQALADDFGYVQGTFVSRAAVMAYLNSPRARQVAGL